MSGTLEGVGENMVGQEAAAMVLPMTGSVGDQSG
jgi:hypothetical protein